MYTSSPLHKRLLFLQIAPLVYQFLTILLDALGIMINSVLLKDFHKYLGRHSPAMTPFIHRSHFIGHHGHHNIVDKYGGIIARATIIGDDWHTVCGELKDMIGEIFWQAEFGVKLEAPHIFPEKVPCPALSACIIMHSNRDTIIPVLLVHSFLSILNGNCARSMEVRFDVKTLRTDKNAQLCTNWRTGFRGQETNTQVMNVRKDYQMRAIKLYIQCTPDDDTYPFKDALHNHFNSGRVHPLIFGAFGKINLDTSWLQSRSAPATQRATKRIQS